MYTVYYFIALDNEYGDCGTRKTEQEHRPLIGDLVPDYLFREYMSTARRDDADEKNSNAFELVSNPYFHYDLYEVERVMYVGNSSFYAYCNIVGNVRDKDLWPMLGKRGDLESLAYHCLEQEISFRRGSFIAPPAE